MTLTNEEFLEAMNERARNDAELDELRRNPPKPSVSLDEAVRAHFEGLGES